MDDVKFVIYTLVVIVVFNMLIALSPWGQESGEERMREYQAKSQLCKVSGGVYTYREYAGYVCDKTLIDVEDNHE